MVKAAKLSSINSSLDKKNFHLKQALSLSGPETEERRRSQNKADQAVEGKKGMV